MEKNVTKKNKSHNQNIHCMQIAYTQDATIEH